MLYKNRFSGYLAGIAFVIFVSVSGLASAQTAASLTAERTRDLKLDSKLMKREMPYRVIVPADYMVSNETKFYPTLYLLHGLTGHFNNWSENTKLAEYSKAFEFVIVMPEGNNGWYSDSAAVPNDKYESYIARELMPEIEKQFRVKKTRESRAIAGLSMGGYGALKFGLKYPEKFIVSGSFSGALRAAEWNGESFSGWKVLADSITTTFGGIKSDTREENNLFSVLESKSKDDLSKLPFFYIDCGTEDGLLKQNQDFAQLLIAKKVPHEFRQLPGKHDWKFWDAQVQEFFDLTKKFVK